MEAQPTTTPSNVSLQAGRDALAKGEWDEARAIFDALVAAEPVAAAYDGQSWAAWWQNDGQTVFDARERAYQLYREAGDALGAARMAVWLANDYIDFRGEMAVSNGWLQVGRRLLDETPTAEEHGWLAVLEAEMALLLNEESETGRRWAQQAVAIGRQAGAADVEVMGRMLEGVSFVIEGEMARGLSALDEAAAEALGGEVTNLFTVSSVLCHVLYACERAQDFDRAAQWCRRVKDFAGRVNFTFAQGTCRAHYAGVLVWRGMWAEAEKELADASRYLLEARPPFESEARVRLAELRRRQGRLEEAAALFREVEWHPLAPLGLAQLALSDGRLRDAEEYAQRLLRSLPEKSIAQRAAAYEVLARVQASAGQQAEAQETCERFDAIAAIIGTQPLRATSASLAAVLAIAAGEENEARRHLEDAIVQFDRCGAPYEAARARLELAGILGRQARPERAGQEARTALGVFQRLGAGAEAARAEGLLNSLDQAARTGAVPPRGALTGRQLEILRLVAQGMSDREVAFALVMSEHTVHRHVANILQRLNVPSRAAAVAETSRLGLL